MSRKYIGDFNGVPVYEDPACPPGKLYLLSDSYQEPHIIDARSRWQRFIGWLKRLFQLKR